MTCEIGTRISARHDCTRPKWYADYISVLLARLHYSVWGPDY